MLQNRLFCMLALIFALCPAIPLPASADFFRYIDKQGNVIYTDDLNKVPADQRERAKTYEEAPPGQPAAAVPENASQDAAPDAGRKATEAGGTDAKERQNLQEREDALNNEYKNLTAERTKLDEERKKAVSREQVKDLNRKVSEFNSRIEAYEKKRSALEADVNAFNSRLGDRQKQDAGKP